ESATETQVTGVGTVLGTVAYMSPEQAEGKPVDARTDVFSFGVVLYEMLAGRRPFGGDSTLSTLTSILRDPPPLEALGPNVPAPLRSLVGRCLEKSRERRFESGREIAAELAGLSAVA